MPRFVLPDAVTDMARRGDDWAVWVRTLPATIEGLLDEWSLRAEDGVWSGHCAVVVAVRTVDDEPAVLKVGWQEEQTEHEHLALRHWDGAAAVRLLRADPRRGALLLERLHQQHLGELWDVEACEVVGGLYPRLHVPAPSSFHLLTTSVARWTEGLKGLPRSAPLPHRLVEQARSLGRDFVDDVGSTGTLIHADLHDENVLASDRQPWLAIDPQPLSGDPHYEPAPMLWNRWDEVTAGPDGVRAAVRRRFHTLVDVAGLDEDRARDWVVVRMLHNALWALEDADRGQPLDHDWLTTCVAVAKAVQ